MPTYGIALGSNLGGRRALVAHGRDLLSPDAVCAPLYESEPVGCPPGSPRFLNTVVEIESPLAPLELLAETAAIEAALGRGDADRRTKNAPRPLDIDLLYAGTTTLDTPELTLPHPRLHLRRFVLQPLADIRPDLVLPGFTETAASLLRGLQSGEPPLTLVAEQW